MTRREGRPRRGTTLIEVITVLVILSTGMLVAGVAFRRTPSRVAQPLHDAVASARRTASEQGRAVRLTTSDTLGIHTVTAMPDGSVIADERLGVDRWTGQVR